MEKGVKKIAYIAVKNAWRSILQLCSRWWTRRCVWRGIKLSIHTQRIYALSLNALQLPKTFNPGGNAARNA